jgi:hypothetical protein
LCYADAKKYTIASIQDFEKTAADAAAFAAAEPDQKVMVELSGAWSMDAEDLVVFRKILGAENISTLNGADIVAETSRHPTSAYVLNSTYGLTGKRIKLKAGKDSAAHQGEKALMANDTTLWVLRTKTAPSNVRATMDAVDDNLNLTDPILGLYAHFNSNHAYDPNAKSVDGQPVQKMNFSSIDADGLKILLASLGRANAGASGSWSEFFTPYLTGTVRVKLPSDEKYYGKYAIPGGSVTAINLNYADLRSFNPEFIEWPSVPNFCLLMSMADRIELSGAACVVMIVVESYRWGVWDPTGQVDVKTLVVNALKENRVFPVQMSVISLSEQFLKGSLFPLNVRDLEKERSDGEIASLRTKARPPVNANKWKDFAAYNHSIVRNRENIAFHRRNSRRA